MMTGLHAGAAWMGLHWVPSVKPAPEPPPAAVMIDLAHLPTAAPAPPSEDPPGPQQTLSQPPPAPEIQPSPLQVPPAHAPEVAVPITEKPRPRPLPRSPPVKRRPPPRRIPDRIKPAPATTAPPQAEAPPAPTQEAPAPGSSAAAPSSAVPTWQGLLLGQLERLKRYPYEAQSRR